LISTKLFLNSFSWFYTNSIFKDYRETTLFISMDYSYNPTSEPLLFGMTYVMGFTSNHKWAVFNTIILNDDNNP